MATLLYSEIVAEQYKEVSDIISAVEINKKDVRKKNIKDIMQESFFHGASWLGNNFIA